MKFYKTKNRTTYTYEFKSCTGAQKIKLVPGNDEVTEAVIKKLHALDDSEVYYNCKERGKMTAEEKAEWEKYEETHFVNPKHRLSLDYEFEGKVNQEYQDAINQNAVYQPCMTDREFRLHELIAMLPPRQKQVITLVGLEQYTQVEVCRMLGLGKGTVNEHLKKAQKFIKENFFNPNIGTVFVDQ